MQTLTYYDPINNKVYTGTRHPRGENAICLGERKIAEAFTCVSEKERKKLWLALHGSTYSFDFSMLNSKIRHKLKRLGLKPYGKRLKYGGEELLQKFLAKKNEKKFFKKKISLRLSR